MKTKKSKLFKTISFSSLALLMGAAGVFAFAPLGASPSVASANEMVDQINTKADGEKIKYAPSALGLDPENDPVIYTTESGLEIKYGGLDLEGTLESGALTGYPYFTMGTYSGYAVNWVIIGRASDVTEKVQIGEGVESVLFSNWKANSQRRLRNYFINNIFETNSPAGVAINSATEAKSYVIDDKIMTINLSSIKNTAEIDNGCVLALSEKCLYYHTFNSSANANYEGSTIQTSIQNLYSSTLGLTSTQKALIQPQSFSNAGDGYSSSSSGQYMFLLSYSSANFKVTNYLSTNALRVGYTIDTSEISIWWLRDGGNDPYSTSVRGCLVSDGTITGNGASGVAGAIETYHGTAIAPSTGDNNRDRRVRPACVVKIF